MARVVQIAGMLTVLALGSFLFVMFRRDIRTGQDQVLTQGREARRMA